MNNTTIIRQDPPTTLSLPAPPGVLDSTETASTSHRPTMEDCPDKQKQSNSSSDQTQGEMETKLSKRQMKKLAKQQKWEDTKAYRRAKAKAKRKEFVEKRRQGLVDNYVSRKQKRANTMKGSDCKVGMAIDMSFNHLMADKVT